MQNPTRFNPCLARLHAISRHSMPLHMHASKNTITLIVVFHGILIRPCIPTLSFPDVFLYMQGPMASSTFTPGPDSVEKVIWSRSSSRQFELPCSGDRLTNRDGLRDDVSPFTCGSYPRRAVLKHFIRRTYGGAKYNDAARQSVVKAVLELVNRTRKAWSFDSNYMCTCPNGSTTGWECCDQQADCATEPCACADGSEVKMSVACCTSVCGGLAGNGLMEPFASIPGSTIARDLLDAAGSYLQNDIWTSTDPWLVYDPLGADAYKSSWQASSFEVADAALFDASNPVVYYDETFYPFKSTPWAHCAGLLQQAMWTMPLDRSSGRPDLGSSNVFDPIMGESGTVNLTYTEEFVQSLTLRAYKSSPLYWHYNVRYAPSQSEVCKRSSSRPFNTSAHGFSVGGNTASKLGFSSMTLGGLGGSDCYCGWWYTAAGMTMCQIPASLCDSLVQIIGFSRICTDQGGVYNSSLDHSNVLDALDSLMSRQPSTVYACPLMRISEHWGFMGSDGLPYANATNTTLYEGVSGFRVGNSDWLFAQTPLQLLGSRVDTMETHSTNAALVCDIRTDPSIADHFVDDLFPVAQGVRQSMPQSYCMRYGIEVARLTVYTALGLNSAAGQQHGVVDGWRKRCQYKLQELAVCKQHGVLQAGGAPQSTSGCPFTISAIQSVRSSYAVTPGCLIILWGTADQNGIYDPCICSPCTHTPDFDIPGQLTSACRLEGLQSIIGDDVIIDESSTDVPIDVMAMVMQKVQVNTPDIKHWALHTAIRDADLLLDWWPDTWRHPVGYHVTPGCTVDNSSPHWKTFDASWRWDSVLQKMVLSKDETNDPFLSRNAFGASGVCRTNNFGYPMSNLNTMAVCTQENANAAADPMVPVKSTTTASWVDGPEYCAPDALQTPWYVDRTKNPPRQWTVGTLQSENPGLSPFRASEWGGGCGPYPLLTCRTSLDCALNLTCVSSVCVRLQTGLFECTSHSQCPNDKMCAGDGICVDGVWQVENTLPDVSVAFRSHSQSCGTGDALDTWGTSAAELVPDILNASGLCSYRAWFENRRMSQRNQCTQSDTCSMFSGTSAWNFTSPRKASSYSSAFDDSVLRVGAHACDRDYQHYEGFVSCTPNDNFGSVYDRATGNALQRPSTGFARDKRTRTYRPNMQLPLMHHTDNAHGSTFGFTGISTTYTALGLGTSSPSIIPCASTKVCGFQPRFTVNGITVVQRMVIDGGASRGYRMQDLLQCGVFGFLLQSGNGICQLDYAVVPLASYVLVTNPSLRPSGFTSSTYTPGNVQAVLANLQAIPDIILTKLVGGAPVSLQDYVTKSNVFLGIYATIQKINNPVYAAAGAPSQLYYLTQFGAYEVPFAWWFKCRWLAGIAMDSSPQQQCSWRIPSAASQPTSFTPFDSRFASLLNMPSDFNPSFQSSSSLQSLLVALPGIITQSILDNALRDFTARRNKLLASVGSLLQGVSKMCYQSKKYVQAYSDASERYQLQRLNQMLGRSVFDTASPYVDSRSNVTVCSGVSQCLESAGFSHPVTSNADLVAGIMAIENARAVSVVSSLPMTTVLVDTLDNVSVPSLFRSSNVDYMSSPLTLAFQNLPDGCNAYTSATSPGAQAYCLCSSWDKCSSSIQTAMLGTGPSPLPSSPCDVTFQGSSVDMCSPDSNIPKCAISTSMRGVTSVSVPVGASFEMYTDSRWPCVKVTCGASTRMAPADFKSFPSTTVEKVVVEEIVYTQKAFISKTNPWPDQFTQDREVSNSGLTGNLPNVVPNMEQRFDVQNCQMKYPVALRDVVYSGYDVKLKVHRVTYYVNGSLRATFDTYPCSEDPLWQLEMRVMRLYNTYRLDIQGLPVDYPECFYDTGGRLPNATRLVRFPRHSSVGQDVLDAVERVVGTMNLNRNQLCTDSICTVTTSTGGGFIGTSGMSSSDLQSACTRLKADSILGCSLYPGESSIVVISRYVNGCPSYINMPVLRYTECMNDDPRNACASLDPRWRDMQPTGTVFTYELTTVADACIVGPKTLCSLQDETLSDSSFACPGLNQSSARYRGYANLVTYDQINTHISLVATLVGPIVATGLQEFDHAFLSLEQGYSCSSSSQSCDAGSVSVQMRANLWRCIPCPMVSDTQCTGQHNCLITSPNLPLAALQSLDGWSTNLTAAQRSFLTGGVNSSIEVSLPAMQWFIGQVTTALEMQGVGLSYDVPAFMTSYADAASSYQYNPLPVVDYSSTMSVTSKSCGNNVGLLPDFSNCSYDGHRRALKTFVHNNYKVSDGFILPPGKTLMWKVTRSQATSQNIPSWTVASNSSSPGMFITSLFDDAVCQTGNVVDNACYIHTVNSQTVVDVLNPGLLGAFEPQVGCDTDIINGQRVVSAVCGSCNSTSEYLALESGATMPCPQYYAASPGVTTDIDAPSSLCSKTPVYDATCGSNLQGMLGQKSYDGSPVSTVYKRVLWPGSLQAGIASNRLLQNTVVGNAPSNLILSGNDIGGHFVRMTVGVTRSGAFTMQVRALPLSSYADATGPIAYALGTSSSSGFGWTQINTASETDALRKTLYPNSVCATWDCPLRRRAFYAGVDVTFRPSVPDPLRTQVMYGSMPHPTQRAFPMPRTALSTYTTSNGFCSCLPSSSCTKQCAQDTPALSGIWTYSSAAPTGCNLQVDWPYMGGTLRDGTTFAQRTASSCGLVDRLPAFRYRYSNRKQTTNGAKTTLDKGGVCHMGWPIVTAGPLAGCWLLTTDSDSYMCPGFQSPRNVTRLRAQTVDELLAAPTRARLADCKPPPDYYVVNATTPPEVSYGQPMRWEASRMLARDLRQRLCGNSSVCEASASWSLATFWSDVYAKYIPAPSKPATTGDSNSSLWTEPWVACVQASNGTQHCDGTIPRDKWIQSGNRSNTCLDAITGSSLASSLAQPISICDLDSTMDTFCRTVQDARYRVFEANCLYSGQCRQRLFFYQPSTYAVDNQQFVRTTVQQFYNNTVKGACVPDIDTQAAIAANAQALKNCAAFQLSTLSSCLQAVRVVMDLLVEIAFYAGELCLFVFELLGSGDAVRESIVAQINALLQLIRNKCISLFNELGDLLYHIVFDGPMGQWITSMITAVCSFLDWLFSDVVYVVLCWTRAAALFFLNNVASGIVSVINAISFGRLGDLNTQIANAVTSVETNIPCSPKDLWSCNLDLKANVNPASILPLPTRCWAGVEPGVSSLACTAADTCLQTSDYSNVVCAACPQAMVQFGCDTLTKLCTCNVFPVGITSCSSHEECALDGVDCQYVDSYLQPSYGNLPCTQCTGPICLIADGSGVGRCSCLLRPVPLQSCSDVGQSVSPSAQNLCLVATVGGGLSASVTYTRTLRTLASTPCMLLNQASSYCMQVYTSASVSTPLVVGLALLQTRRRRLFSWVNHTEDDGVDNRTDEAVFNSTDLLKWDGEGEPCRALAMANIPLGILESHALAECIRWHDIGARLVLQANLTRVNDYFLVSWRDLLSNVLKQGALADLFARLPTVAHEIFLHFEFTQPLMLAVMYGVKLLPRDVWLNQTVLDDTRAFFINYTTATTTPRRRLLQSNDVPSSTISTEPTSQTVYEWSQGPFTWPPNFVFWSSDTHQPQCALVSTAVNVVEHAVASTMQYYTVPVADPLPVQWPRVYDLIRSDVANLLANNITSLAAGMPSAAAALINASVVESFLDNAQYGQWVSSLLQCNFTRIQTCEDRRDLFWSTLQVLIVILVIGIGCRLLEVPYADPILLLLVIPSVLYFTYGYAPTCAPLIPTCAFRDLVSLLNNLFPARIDWPEPLTTRPNCTSVSCLKSCKDDTIIGFSQWEDHVAWMMIEFGIPYNYDSPSSYSRLSTALTRKSIDVLNPSMVFTQRICFAITAVNSVPVILFVSLLLWLVPSLIAVTVASVQFCASLLLSLVLFVHGGGRRREDD